METQSKRASDSCSGTGCWQNSAARAIPVEGARANLQACAEIPGKQRAGRSSRWGTDWTHSNSPGSIGNPCYSWSRQLHPSTHRHLPRKKCLRRPPNPDHATLSMGSPVPLWVPTLSPAEVPRLQRNSPEIRCSAPPRHLGCRRADTSPSASPWSCLLRVHKVPATALAPTPSLRPRAFLL